LASGLAERDARARMAPARFIPYGLPVRGFVRAAIRR
jgi:hypothetical protein